MIKRIGLILILVSFGLCPLMAGDIATMVNLGFSDSSDYFMFGQYGIDDASAQPYAELFVVDVAKNTFVSDGVRSAVFDHRVSPGNEALGALLILLQNSDTLRRQYDIDHLAMGRLVYLLINGKEPKSRLEFRDFRQGNSYVVSLVQEQFTSDDSISASFHVNLSVTDKSGDTEVYTIGLPNYRRKNVRSYRIKQVIFTPDEKSLVFVIEKELQTDDGVDVRYMVETVTM